MYFLARGRYIVYEKKSQLLTFMANNSKVHACNLGGQKMVSDTLELELQAIIINVRMVHILSNMNCTADWYNHSGKQYGLFNGTLNPELLSMDDNDSAITVLNRSIDGLA
ncbi:hypothetical protein STEG23_031751 [Scotinomys teguina]